MDYLLLAAIGVLMGVFGGLLGIGGSVIMIPALVFAFGENQHLYQASAMICNFFVGAAAVAVHKKEEVLVGSVLKWLVPSAVLGVLGGVWLSNSSLFARENSWVLARVYGFFMVYVVIYNSMRFRRPRGGADGLDISGTRRSGVLAAVCGLASGVPAGLLGIGGGIVCIPAQQFFLRMPLKRAASNSAAMIACVAIVGAIYKNATLAEHGISVVESLKIAALVVPGAIVGALVGGRAMYKLPVNVVRAVFIVVAGIACYRMLTVSAGG